jgi:citrate synthase
MSTPLLARLSERVSARQLELKETLRSSGERALSGPVTVSQAVGGARDVPAIFWEVSCLDAREGIRYRGIPLAEVVRSLPRASGSGEPLPEALLWLLLVGELPTQAEADGLTGELHRRALLRLPRHVEESVVRLPTSMHPMTQLAAAVLLLQPQSHFARTYSSGGGKATDALWRACLEDALDLIAVLPRIAALIYRQTYHGGRPGAPYSSSSDYAGNFAGLLGFRTTGGGGAGAGAGAGAAGAGAGPSSSSSSSSSSSEGGPWAPGSLADALRLYLVLHADHEGGNVSAHTTRLVGSALSDPYFAFAAAMCGLAGPLHGLANQESLAWILALQKELGAGTTATTTTMAKTTSGAAAAAAAAAPAAVVTREAVEAFTWKTLRSGKVIPGYGHAVLRVTDPRYLALRDFCARRFPEDPLYRVVSTVYEVVPEVLKKQGKTKNPWPNVDAHSGVLLTHYGLVENTFYTVLFGVSRAFGVLSQLVWDRALSLPLERPKSIDLAGIQERVREGGDGGEGADAGAAQAGTAAAVAVAAGSGMTTTAGAAAASTRPRL